MALFDKKNLSEKFAQAKESLNNSMTEFKEKNAEAKAERDAAKAPLEGALLRYQVVSLGGFPRKPEKKTASNSFGFNVMEDRFVFKPEVYTREWFGEENFEIPYEKVTNFEIVKRQVSSTEAMLSSNGDTKSLEQLNNIEITHINDNGFEVVTRSEVLTGTTVYGQAEKCRELLDLLREKGILNKLKKEVAPVSGGGDDVLAQIEKLSSLKEKGILSEEEFAQKKTALLEKL